MTEPSPSLLRRHRPKLIILGAFVVAAVLIMSRPDSPQRPVREKTWVVDTQPVLHKTLSPVLELFGRVESYEDAQLSAGISAEVFEVHVRDGDLIEKGGLLVSLDGRDARLKLLEREAEVKDIRARMQLEQRRISRNRDALVREKELLALATNNAERARSLFNERLLSQANLDTTSETEKRQELALSQRELALEESQLGVVQLEAQLARAEAQRDQAQLEVDRAQVKAPFAGIVSEVAVSMGDRVASGEVLMRLFNPDSLEVRAQIPSRYTTEIRDGLVANLAMPASIEVDGRPIAGRVIRVAGQTRRGSGGVDSFIALDEQPEGIRLGTTVRLTLQLPPQDQVVAVPAEAIYGSDRLYRVVDGRMQMLAVERVGELLDAGSSKVIVRSVALKDGDEIITTKLSNAVDGLLIQTAADVPPSTVARQP